MRDCVECGVAMPGSAKFCRSCGTPAAAVASPAPEVGPSADPGCSSCGAALAPDARFCRSCGAAAEEQTWPGSESPLDPADPGERVTAALVTAPEPHEWCEICGGPVDEPGGTCSSCSDLLGSQRREPTAVMPVGAVPPPRPAQAERGGRGGFYALIATVVILFAVAGGAAAYFLVIAPEKEEAPSASAGVRSAAPASSPPATDPESTTEEDPEAAEEVLRDHYTAIDEGDYERAFSLFHPDYQASVAGRKFLGDRQKGQPDFDLDSLEIEPVGEADGDVLSLRLEFVVADTAGEGRGLCRRFFGTAAMQSVDGSWTYRPGTEATKLDKMPLPSTDARCPGADG